MIPTRNRPSPSSAVQETNLITSDKVNDDIWQCEQCNVTETPQRRRGRGGRKSLCNACGIKFQKMPKDSKANKVTKSRQAKIKHTEVNAPSKTTSPNDIQPSSQLLIDDDAKQVTPDFDSPEDGTNYGNSNGSNVDEDNITPNGLGRVSQDHPSPDWTVVKREVQPLPIPSQGRGRELRTLEQNIPITNTRKEGTRSRQPEKSMTKNWDYPKPKRRELEAMVSKLTAERDDIRKQLYSERAEFKRQVAMERDFFVEQLANEREMCEGSMQTRMEEYVGGLMEAMIEKSPVSSKERAEFRQQLTLERDYFVRQLSSERATHQAMFDKRMNAHTEKAFNKSFDVFRQSMRTEMKGYCETLLSPRAVNTEKALNMALDTLRQSMRTETKNYCEAVLSSRGRKSQSPPNSEQALIYRCATKPRPILLGGCRSYQNSGVETIDATAKPVLTEAVEGVDGSEGSSSSTQLVEVRNDKRKRYPMYKMNLNVDRMDKLMKTVIMPYVNINGKRNHVPDHEGDELRKSKKRNMS